MINDKSFGKLMGTSAAVLFATNERSIQGFTKQKQDTFKDHSTNILWLI